MVDLPDLVFVVTPFSAVIPPASGRKGAPMKRLLFAVSITVVLVATMAFAEPKGPGETRAAHTAAQQGANLAPASLVNPELVMDLGWRAEWVWANFQAAVQSCMAVNNLQYRPVAMPTGLKATNPPQAGHTSYNATNVGTGFKEPTSANRSAWLQMTATQRYAYSYALRGAKVRGDVYDPDAHDGVSDLTTGRAAGATRGCEATARAVVSERAEHALRDLFPAINNFSQLLASENSSEAQQQWANCMEVKGYSYSVLIEPARDAQTKAKTFSRTSPGFADTVAAAVAAEQNTYANDVSCRASSGWDAFVQNELASPWNTFVEENRTLILQALGVWQSGYTDARATSSPVALESRG